MAKENEIWQYRGIFEDGEWTNDTSAMQNPAFKSFKQYKKHIDLINKKFKTQIEYRLLPNNSD